MRSVILVSRSLYRRRNDTFLDVLLRSVSISNPNVLWVDSSGGLVAGAVVLAAAPWLAQIEGLPRSLLLFTGTMNLLYGCYSFLLATRERRSRSLIHLLIFANFGWALACLAFAVSFARAMSWVGGVHLVGEALIVGGLAMYEWSVREQLVKL